MEGLSYKLEVFEGPLELLLSLIQKHKLDIYDIPISLILEQYTASLEQLGESMEITAEFVDMTAQLILIKSRLLLPSEEDEEDPRAGLVAALLEYQRAKQIADYFETRLEDAGERFIKPMDLLSADNSIRDGEYQAKTLYEAFRAIYLRNRRKMPPPATSITNITNRRVVSVSERAIAVLRALVVRKQAPFIDFFSINSTKHEIIATFMAILELLKGGRINVSGDDVENCTVSLSREAGERLGVR